MTTDSKPALVWSDILAACGIVLVAWLVYVQVGLPLTNVDDLFFVGVAENLSKGGELSSPVMKAEYFQGLQTNKFYFHPPFYPWLMAFWLKAFPFSQVSLQSFAFVITTLGAFSLVFIGRKLRIDRIPLMALAAIYMVSFARLGLRPEVAAFSFLFLGNAFLLSRTVIGIFMGILCLGLSVLFYAITAPLGLGIIIFSFIFNDSRKATLTLIYIGSGLASLLLLIFLFGIAIKWDFCGFTDAFIKTAQSQNPGPPFSSAKYLRYMELLSTGSKFLPKWPFLLAGVAALTFATAISFSTLKIRTYLWLLLVGLIGAAGIAHLRSTEISLLVAWIILFFLISGIPVLWIRYVLLSLTCSMAAAANMNAILSLALQSNVPTEVLQKANAVLYEKNSRKDMLIDSSIARYILGWKMPNHSYDIHTSRPLLISVDERCGPRKQQDLQPNEVCVISKTVTVLESQNQATSTTILGIPFSNISRYRCEPTVIESKNRP